MKKINSKFVAFILFVIAVMCALGVYIVTEDKKMEEAYISIMEKRLTFTGEEVDILWNFRNDHNVSEEFEKLYQKKIKPLSGWQYGEETGTAFPEIRK